jgi:hypothetical protein
VQKIPPKLKGGPPAAPRFLEPRFKRDDVITEFTMRSRRLSLELFEERVLRKLDEPALISSAHGAIKQVLLTLPDDLLLDDDGRSVGMVSTIKNLLQLLPPEVQFIIVTNDSSQLRLGKLLSDLVLTDRSQQIQLDDSFDFTIWAEDPYAICLDLADGDKFFVEPSSFFRREDALIADFVANRTVFDNTRARLHFQGGNILVGDKFWLLGMDSIIESHNNGEIEPRPNEKLLDAARRKYSETLDRERLMIPVGSRLPVRGFPQRFFKREFQMNGETWQEKLFFGNKDGTVQPIFHIDMFLTLAGRDAGGRYRILVGDPREAAEILNQEIQPHAMVEIFDDIADQFRALDFDVIRNPLPLTYDDDEHERLRTWYFATANNALVEITATSKQVWLPTYGHDKWPELAATDERNLEIWQNLGFTAHKLGDFNPFASQLGAAHCIKKYLVRD